MPDHVYICSTFEKSCTNLHGQVKPNGNPYPDIMYSKYFLEIQSNVTADTKMQIESILQQDINCT